MLTIGPYTISLIETGRFGLDGGAMFGVVPRTLWEKAYATPDERNRIPMAARVLVIRGEGRTILVDTGNTPLMPPKQADIYKLDFDTYDIERDLAAIGVTQDAVTDVILTHLHFDHAGGCTLRNEAGVLQPRFPNATVHVQKDHYAWAMNPTEKDRASFIPETWEAVQQAGLLRFVDGPGELFPMINVDLVHGHTSALQTVRIADGTSTLFFPADLMPTAAHIAIPFVMGYDNFPLTSIAEKKAIVPRAIEENWLVVFGHDANRQAGYLEWGEKGPRIRAEVTLRD